MKYCTLPLKYGTYYELLVWIKSVEVGMKYDYSPPTCMYEFPFPFLFSFLPSYFFMLHWLCRVSLKDRKLYERYLRIYLRLLKRKLKIPLLWKWRWPAIRRWKSSGTSPIPTILSIRGPGGEASIRLCPNINLQSCNSFSEALMDGPMLSGGHSPQL